MKNDEKNINFLQSNEWAKFQASSEKGSFFIEKEGFSASIVEHKLFLVGKYFYIPKGPAFSVTSNQQSAISGGMQEIIELAKKNNIGWIRIDPENEEILNLIRQKIHYKITKAPHDMQPKEIFTLDITKSEEELMSEMSQKTRYNIRLAQKRGVVTRCTSNITRQKDIEEFLRLVKATAKRKGIVFHPEEYYRKMLKTIPENMLKLYVAEYESKIIAANLVVFFGDTVTYLHGATDDEYRNVMAPHLLQWQAMLDAKVEGCKKYDFGGIKTMERSDLTPTLSLLRRGRKGEVNPWAGITKFKIGFSPNTQPIEFPGSYDIIINRWKYAAYLIFSWIFSISRKIIK